MATMVSCKFHISPTHLIHTVPRPDWWSSNGDNGCSIRCTMRASETCTHHQFSSSTQSKKSVAAGSLGCLGPGAGFGEGRRRRLPVRARLGGEVGLAVCQGARELTGDDDALEVEHTTKMIHCRLPACAVSAHACTHVMATADTVGSRCGRAAALATFEAPIEQRQKCQQIQSREPSPRPSSSSVRLPSRSARSNSAPRLT